MISEIIYKVGYLTFYCHVYKSYVICILAYVNVNTKRWTENH